MTLNNGQNADADVIKAAINAGGTFTIPGTDHAAVGQKITLTAAAAMAFGDVGYIDAAGKVAIADADAIATSCVTVMCADASIGANASGTFLLMGVVRDDTWNWTVGGFAGMIYLSTTGTTGNTLTQTQPSGADDVIQVLGYALSADVMLFNPNSAQVEHT